jgi:hypothetical protein
MFARPTLRSASFVAAPALVILGAAAWWSARAEQPTPPPTPAVAAASPRGEVRLRVPTKTPAVDTGRRDAHGQPVTVSCGTCHATRTPEPATRSAAELNDFHGGLTYAHGAQSCLGCHDARDYDRLHLADGASLPFEQVVTLCGQCHGPQKRDFDHGAHGGMNGHWDLSAGDRVRNACTACHDPHAPAYPAAMPVFPPRDAYQVRGRSHD